MCDVEVINKTDSVKEVARMWRDQYYDKFMQTWDTRQILAGEYKTSQEVYNALLAPGVVEADLQRIIGSASWPIIECDCCHREVDAVVRVEVDKQYSSTDICLDCLKRFSALLEADT